MSPVYCKTKDTFFTNDKKYYSSLRREDYHNEKNIIWDEEITTTVWWTWNSVLIKWDIYFAWWSWAPAQPWWPLRTLNAVPSASTPNTPRTRKPWFFSTVSSPARVLLVPDSASVSFELFWDHLSSRFWYLFFC